MTSGRRAATLVALGLILFPHLARDVAAQPATRCGWLVNPTPANAWLHDARGQWIIASQGGRQIEDDWSPDYANGQWVRTGGGSYGYGCACMDIEVDPAASRVTRIHSVKARPLSACRKDPALRGVEAGLR